MDEMSIYSRALSDSEIQAIYRVSAFTTNRNIGKFDPSVTPAEGLAEAQVSLGGMTNLIFGENSTWQQTGFLVHGRDQFAAAANSRESSRECCLIRSAFPRLRSATCIICRNNRWMS
jgi:uncharacterized protein YukJ